jgi:hypothetical protein
MGRSLGAAAVMGKSQGGGACRKMTMACNLDSRIYNEGGFTPNAL